MTAVTEATLALKLTERINRIEPSATMAVGSRPLRYCASATLNCVSIGFSPVATVNQTRALKYCPDPRAIYSFGELLSSREGRHFSAP